MRGAQRAGLFESPTPPAASAKPTRAGVKRLLRDIADAADVSAAAVAYGGREVSLATKAGEPMILYAHQCAVLARYPQRGDYIMLLFLHRRLRGRASK